jgi:hypothetical protein
MKKISSIIVFENPESENSDHLFSFKVPNILHELTYTISNVNGIKTIKRLSVYARMLYMYILRCESLNEICYDLHEDIALKIRCSKNKISKAIQELLMPMNQLSGKSLIIITKDKIELNYISLDVWREGTKMIENLKSAES